MIFAKVDVTFPRHTRIESIPSGILRAAALGVWAAALCYSREHKLDGFCPMCAIDKFATDDVIEHLVSQRLFARDVDDEGRPGVVVLKYAEHNETRVVIEERLAADRLRKKNTGNPAGRRGRSRKDSERNPKRIQETPGGGIPDSDSDSDSRSSEGEPERDLTIDPLRSPASEDRVVGRGDELTEALRWIAEKYNVQDIAGSWGIFCGHYAGKYLNVPGTWQAWCIREAKKERREREQGRQFANRGAQPPVQPPKPIKVTPEDVEDAERAYKAFRGSGEDSSKAAIAAAGGKRQ